MTHKSKFAADEKTPLWVVRARLEWVKRKIMADWKRYDQNSFLARRIHGNTCGTVGCIAGWLDVRMNGMRAHIGRSSDKHRDQPPNEEVIAVAMRALGAMELPGLFYGDIGTAPGTRAHARAGCKRIDRYLKEIGV